jgi:hypothetical protein
MTLVSKMMMLKNYDIYQIDDEGLILGFQIDDA